MEYKNTGDFPSLRDNENWYNYLFCIISDSLSSNEKCKCHIDIRLYFTVLQTSSGNYMLIGKFTASKRNERKNTWSTWRQSSSSSLPFHGLK